MNIINPKGKNRWGYRANGMVATNESLYKLLQEILVDNSLAMSIHWATARKIDGGDPWRCYYINKTGPLPILIHQRLRELTINESLNKGDWL